MESEQPPVITPSKLGRFWVLLKIGGICLLILLLHVPLSMTQGVLWERKGYQQQVVSEIENTWGAAQMVSGPVLVVPWTRTSTWTTEWKDKEGEIRTKVQTSKTDGWIYFLPETLKASAQVDPERRHRGIFDAVVFAAKVELEGSFVPAIPAEKLKDTEYHWDKSMLCFGVTDVRRLRASPVVSWDDVQLNASTNSDFNTSELALAARVAEITPEKEYHFAIKLGLQGGERLEIAPVGRQTDVTIASSWPNPSFTGVHLPATHEIGEQGFSAKWEIGPFGRDYPFTWTNEDMNVATLLSKLPASSIGVSLAQPVDGYRLAERAQKYGVLFFVLVFTVFFLFEIMAKLRIHPLQYAMVGAALCLFFLGFLALSEFLPTGVAYGIAAAACTVLISLYSRSVLKSGRRTLVVTGGLAATYSYLYFVLKSQDYALIAGTAALFAALAIVMFCTRRINWYSLEMNAAAANAK